MKRLLVLLLAMTLMMLSACGNGETPTGSTPTQPLPTDPSASSQPTVPTAPTAPTQPWENYATVSYLPERANDGVTYTGLPSLPAVEYRVYDPENLLQLSTERIEHSFGAAANGEPQHITVDNQKRVDGGGTGALAGANVSEEKVLYLTFDCGYAYENLTSHILDILNEKQIPAAFFCTMSYLRSEPEVVARMIKEGHIVGNHSLSHNENSETLSREEMALEALAVENYLRVNFGYSSRYFRFPEGTYSENAVQLLSSVGYRSVFWSIAYADWMPAEQLGEEKAFQTVTSRLHPGAVILLHSTSPNNAAILADFIDYAIAQGYQFRSLDDYPGWN